MKICAVIPAFNEAARVGRVVEDLRRTIATVVVVDDGSSDQTAIVAESAGAFVIRMGSNQGKGAALSAGFRWACDAGFDACLTLDADGQHAAADAGRFLELWDREHPACIVGSRMQDLGAMPPLRRWTNRIMSSLLSRMIGQSVPDTQCGYRLYSCAVLKGLTTASSRFDAESEILFRIARTGHQIRSVTVRTIYGSEQSKIHPVRDTIRFLRLLLRMRYGARQ